MTTRAVCFDLGGVVARITFFWAEMLTKAGLPVPPHVRPDDNIHAMPAFDTYQAGRMPDDAYLRELAGYLGGIPLEVAERVHRGMILDPYPGVEEIVSGLRSQGIVTGCLSNTNAPHWQELTRSGKFPAIDAMDVRLASFEIGAGKPDPRAYRAFESAVGAGGSAITFFDDSEENCRAARALGWIAFRIDPRSDPARQMREALGRAEPDSDLKAS